MEQLNPGWNQRIAEIDFTRGALVLFMVVYHGLNYLGYESVPHDFLSFVPPSFIMIAGFIIAYIYVSKYGLGTRNLFTRLAKRASKILILFTFLNIGALVFLSCTYGAAALNLNRFVENGFEIYLIGGSRRAAFEVLLPIGYLMLLSILLLRLGSLFPYGIGGVGLTTIIASLVMETYGYRAYNLRLISAGTIGMAIGLLSRYHINFAPRSWVALLLFSALYWGCLFLFGDRYLVQIFATILSLAVLYAVANRIDMQNWLPKQYLLLGRYSLMAYIVQIFYLQLFKRSPLCGDSGAPAAAGVILSAAILTWGTVRIVDWARDRNTFVDRAYRLLFA